MNFMDDDELDYISRLDGSEREESIKIVHKRLVDYMKSVIDDSKLTPEEQLNHIRETILAVNNKLELNLEL